MSIVVYKNTRSLDKGFVLTPERYNPNRKLDASNSSNCVKLSDVASIVNDIINPKQFEKYKGKIIIVNTGDAYEGHIKLLGNRDNIWNSNKKLVKPGDVIVSRLRPYLRQIAYVDHEMFTQDEDCVCAVSTEFYVLRGKKGKNIGFLIPLLLSEKIQAVFANAVEGSQHPRFKEDVLLDITIPDTLFSLGEEMSLNVLNNVLFIRQYEKNMKESIKNVARYLN